MRRSHQPRAVARVRPRAAVLVLPLAAAPLLVATACNGSANTTAKDVAYDVTGQVHALEVDSDAGPVTVTEQDVPAVKVRETWHYSGRQPKARHQVTDGTLRLDYDCSHNCWVSYQVTVPRGVAAKIDTTAGSVELNGLSGTVQATTKAGKVDGSGLSGRTVSAHTDAGAIDLRFTAPPDRVTAQTGAGAATVRLPAGQTYAVDASTTVGHTEIKVPTDPSSRHVVTVHTTAGAARVLGA